MSTEASPRPVALVTDLDNPWGRAVAERLAGRCALVVNSRAGRSLGGAALSLTADFARREAVEVAARDITAALGPVDLLVHTDHAVEALGLLDADEAAVDRQLGVNLVSAFWCTQVFGRIMATRGEGAIVYVSSIHGQKPTASAFGYAAAKGGLRMLSREAALPLGRRGVRVNLIEMGAMEGDDVRFASPLSTLYREFPHKVPAGRSGRPEDVALAVEALFGAGPFVNGAELRVDGGFLLHYGDAKTFPPGHWAGPAEEVWP